MLLFIEKGMHSSNCCRVNVLETHYVSPSFYLVKKKSKNKNIQLSTIIKAAKNSMKCGSKSLTVINSALRGARSAVKKMVVNQRLCFQEYFENRTR